MFRSSVEDPAEQTSVVARALSVALVAQHGAIVAKLVADAAIFELLELLLVADLFTLETHALALELDLLLRRERLGRRDARSRGKRHVASSTRLRSDADRRCCLNRQHVGREAQDVEVLRIVARGVLLTEVLTCPVPCFGRRSEACASLARNLSPDPRFDVVLAAPVSSMLLAAGVDAELHHLRGRIVLLDLVPPDPGVSRGSLRTGLLVEGLGVLVAPFLEDGVDRRHALTLRSANLLRDGSEHPLDLAEHSVELGRDLGPVSRMDRVDPVSRSDRSPARSVADGVTLRQCQRVVVVVDGAELELPVTGGHHGPILARHAPQLLERDVEVELRVLRLLHRRSDDPDLSLENLARLLHGSAEVDGVDDHHEDDRDDGPFHWIPFAI